MPYINRLKEDYMSLKESINEIIEVSFNTNDYFDSHTVINELIKNPKHHIEYLKAYSENMNIAQYHGQIAQIISSFGNIKKIGNTKSHTIYGDIRDNVLFQKM